MKILDCTLRDGGYYNNWDFDEVVVNEYLKSMAKAKIDYVELGFRNFPKSGFLGAFAYTTEEFLNSIILPEGPLYGVMVDAKTLLCADCPVENAVDKLFVPARLSKLCLVRVATHFDEVTLIGPILNKLKSLGYVVGVNLMQSGGKSSKAIKEKVSFLKKIGGIDILYFADSLGNMDESEVKRIVNTIRTRWNKDLGIHTHNNIGKGLDNTLCATSLGVQWIDVTITGMGRGAGNTPTEYLLASLSPKENHYNSKPIYELVIRHFEPLKQKYGWGHNILYFLGAQNEIHPTYIQNLLSNPHYGKDEIVGAIDYLSKLEGTTSYNGAVLDTALTFNSVKQDEKQLIESSVIKGKFQDSEVLIISNGPNTQKYAKAICQYIIHKKPIVLSVNINIFIDEDLIDYFIISHNSKFLSDFENYKSLSKPIILPKNRFSKKELEELKCCNLINFGLLIKNSKINLEDDYVISPVDITTTYALSIAHIAGANLISLAGFDGYEKGDRRQKEMIESFTFFKDFYKETDMVSITPTTYPIKQGSVYAIHN